MQNILRCFIAGTLVLMLFNQAHTQDTKAQRGSSPATTESDEPKNEVDRVLEEAKKRGEPVYGVCLEKCGDTKVKGMFEAGHAVHLSKPTYPKIAASAHASGEIRVQVILDTDGKVIAAHAISGHPLLWAVSLSAARNSRFKPTLLDGKPVKVTGVISYNFVRQ
jgi:TonB family protein